MKQEFTKQIPVCQYCNTEIKLFGLREKSYWSHVSAGSGGSVRCTRINLVAAHQIRDFKAVPQTVQYKKEVR